MHENLSFEDAIRTEKSAVFRHFFGMFVIFNMKG